MQQDSGHRQKALVAIVDDERHILSSIRTALEAEGFNVRTYFNGVEALAGLAQEPADLVIIDIKMPHMDGIELLRQLRSKEILSPAIFLTSVEEELVEILAFEKGADDYITKPYSLDVLIQRVRTLLGRYQSHNNSNDSTRGMRVLFRGDLHLGLNGYRCFWKERRIDLTAVEFKALYALAVRPNAPRTRDYLLRTLSVDASVKDIDSLIKRIRRKFKESDENFDEISASYGIGYIWTSARDKGKKD